MAVARVVGLEIGTAKVLALIGEMRENGHVLITGMGCCPSKGVRKGEVIDIENATACVRRALADAEESGKTPVHEVYLALSGSHIQSVMNSGEVAVLDPHRGVGREDIEQVGELAKVVNLAHDREVLHTIPGFYVIDNHERVLRPEGMGGARLGLNMLVLHGLRNRLRNTVQVVRSLSLDVEDVAFSGLCSGLAVLTPEQKMSGAAVVDLGAGTTDYLAYSDGVVVAAGAIGVGGDHVTNDIALAFGVPLKQAEDLKIGSGSAQAAPDGERREVVLPAEMGFQGRTVVAGSLHAVMHARLDELLQMIKRRLAEERVLHRLAAGLVLTGGGAQTPKVVELAQEIFRVPVSVGRPRNISGVTSAMDGPDYAACVGAVQYGFRNMAEQRRGGSLGRRLMDVFWPR